MLLSLVFTVSAVAESELDHMVKLIQPIATIIMFLGIGLMFLFQGISIKGSTYC